MANVKKGNLTPPPQWWKHLDWCKRPFWKSERQAQEKRIVDETHDALDDRVVVAAMPCEWCDGNGDVISIVGEWRGYCICPAGKELEKK